MSERSLPDRAADIIDTDWHCSWHWKRTASGWPTEEGWAEILRDAKSRLESVTRKLVELHVLIKELEERNARENQR